MTQQGRFKIRSRNRSFEIYADPAVRGARRVSRILQSLRSEILDGSSGARIRQIFDNPREIYRLEIELPELGVQRTTLLDRPALEELLEEDEVRARVRLSGPRF